MWSNASMANRQGDVDLRFAQVSAPQLTLWLGQVIIHTYPPVKMEPTERSKTSAFNIQTPGKYPEENIPYLQHGESLKTTITTNHIIRNLKFFQNRYYHIYNTNYTVKVWQFFHFHNSHYRIYTL
jgi:hypothetical protein